MKIKFKNRATRPTIRNGSTGAAVRELQTILNKLGYDVGDVTGIFGPRTEAAVRTFQRNRGLTVDGIVGPVTWNALLSATPPIAPPPTPIGKLRGVVIDAGHGGTDPGASGNGIIEKEFTLKMSLYMAEQLKSFGIPVELSRTTDETLSLTQRTNRINSFFGGAHSDVIVISNHLNAFTNNTANGAEVIYALRNTPELANSILDGIVEVGMRRRSVYQRASANNPSLDHFAIIRDTRPSQSLIIEYGFMTNAEDAARIRNNWRELTKGAVTGIMEYLNRHYDLSGKTPTLPEVTEESENVYIVQAGDSLWSIAHRFGTTVDELIRINNLTDSILSIGQQLLISETDTRPTETFIYVIVPGDTLWSITNRFGTTIEEVMKLNNMSSTTINVGQQLLIPGVAPEPPAETFIYTIVAGDTLWNIANRFNITVEELMQLNNLTAVAINIGQQLVIPGTAPAEPLVYTVVAGDSLWGIANRFGTTVDKIINLNNLTSSIISIGQNLLIP